MVVISSDILTRPNQMAVNMRRDRQVNSGGHWCLLGSADGAFWDLLMVPWIHGLLSHLTFRRVQIK